MEHVTVRTEILRKYCRGKVLDLGASGNSIAPSVGDICAQVDTQDIVNLGKKKLNYLCPADEIPVPSDTYDVVCASHILEHLNNPLKALTEWKRILRPGGSVVAFMPDCRLWITDRKRFEIEELRCRYFARLEFIIEDFNNCIQNHPQGWSDYKPYHSQYYYEHKYIWNVGQAIDMFKYAGLEVLEWMEVPAWFIEIFDDKLLPKYFNKLFLPEDAAKFTDELLLLQEGCGCPMLDYSFTVVARKKL